MAAIRPNPTLSDDLISEILVRVPVKSLLRFQSVCKTWLWLIKHPAFVKSQLRHAITSKTDQTLIMQGFTSRENNKFSLLHVDSRQIVADLKFPYTAHTSLVGSANGIVCVAFYAVDLLKCESRVCLWNPATRQSKVIPLHNDENRAECLVLGCGPVEAWGFGYDPIDHDFKVFRVVSWPSMFAEVYSDNKNVWRKLPDSVDFAWNGDFDVCVNGFLWSVGDYSIMSFDLNKEVLNCAIKLPVLSHDQIFKYKKSHIIEFNKSIAVILLRENRLNADKKINTKINMWMLNDDACLRGGGVEPSWTPMFSLDDWHALQAKPIQSYFSNSDLQLMILRNVDSWIANKKDAKIVPHSIHEIDLFCCHVVYKYTESLVSVAGFKQVNKIGGEDDT